MLTAIYLQRRRLAFGMFFFFLSGLLHFGRFGMWEFPVYVIGMSAVFAVITGLLAVLLVLMFPVYRQIYEIVAITFLGTRFVEAMGWFGAYYSVFDGAWGVILLCLGYTVLFHCVYGAWWVKTPVRLSWRGISRFKTRVGPQDAWARLVPAEDRPGDYYSGTLHEFRPVDEADYTHILRTRMGGPQFIEQRVTVTRNEHARAFGYDFGADVSEANRPLNTGHWEIELTPLGNGTRVEVVEEVVATTPANALLFWFDDLGGQVAVSMKAALEERRDPTILGWLRRNVKAAA